jgi:hypothetical protein
MAKLVVVALLGMLALAAAADVAPQKKVRATHFLNWRASPWQGLLSKPGYDIERTSPVLPLPFREAADCYDKNDS